MLKVYSIGHSLYCAKLRLVLRTKGLLWQDLAPPENYLHLVPTGNLPALVDGALTLTDSEAIAEYLEEKHPNPAMLPNGLEDRAKCRELSRFHDTRLEPALRLLFSNVSPDTRVAEEVSAAKAEIAKRLRALEILLRESPLPRDRLWLADCGLIVTLEWLDIMNRRDVLTELSFPQAVQDYRTQMASLPQVAAELAYYRPHMAEWMESKSGQTASP